MASKQKTTYHRDGTVTYWSVYHQVWARVKYIRERELAAMPAAEASRVLRHLSKNNPNPISTARSDHEV